MMWMGFMLMRRISPGGSEMQISQMPEKKHPPGEEVRRVSFDWPAIGRR